MDRKQYIQRLIEDQFLVEFDGELTAETDLFKTGVMDSFGYIQLLTAVEREFSLQLTDEEFLRNIFSSLEAIDAFVANKLAERDGH
ncbi:phosphopantetheine-binding protein [Streptomyces sp. NBC_01005]|uniref:acyl carrier protein n=1 Tax=unclassified Streptomyces TaxID=2593676 RepID=UPI0022587AB2|nr:MULTISPECIES: phosphopantetheine-binding protein [unclassified Streptomyces]WSW09530.1 phosphopantetheine-binding protein [Streptomyces sp. NBC_01005]WTB52504.1 phosphopantetheine-binding protein [Streptomyces sp. NBC_00826]WTC99035.1 phosphopantetheine-binding protein [Streptomyces sp. NBC_01650]WTH94604.1 phosphopantetheine-binding protein [Streptomyces sp. NBC_00825]WTI03339.1 phosphopantetheine-binding protein [Streptomyces sp. NBC_00822]